MKHLLLFFFFFRSFSFFAQLNEGGIPYSFRHLLQTEPRKTLLAQANMDLIRAEDAVTDQYKDVAWRFGVPIETDIDLNSAGHWEVLENGDRLWRLEIVSQGALSLNLNYDRFFLPPGAKFFVYNPSKEIVLGAFTEKNNREDKLFATSLTKGDRVILEYFEPMRSAGQGDISVKSVVHGYRGFWEPQDFGQAGACNVNVVCPEAAGWENEIRSAVMVLTSSNTRRCSGVMMNNAREDSKPYLYTAEHCKADQVNIVLFNYESSDCDSTTDGSTSDALLIEEVVAQGVYADFLLAVVEGPVPEEYNHFLAGWSVENLAPDTAVCIHHPQGDVKKISFAFDSIFSDTYLSQGIDSNHWQVSDWDIGTTEHRSSGSPLFDMNHRVIGELHGGWAACNNNDADWFGKLATAWEGDPDSTKQLKHWLDPDNTGVLAIDGMNPKVGIKDRFKESIDVSIFPNPSRGNIILQWNEEINDVYSIRLLNLIGQVQLSLRSNKKLLELDLNQLPKGLYFLEINQSFTRKILLQ